VTVAATFQGYQLASQLAGRTPLYEKEDGSVLQRLERVYNAGKHADKWIADGGRFARDSTLPIWITNVGLEVRGYAISFDELASEIEDLASVAVNLSSIGSDAPTS
jgi:hypothetical protein